MQYLTSLLIIFLLSSGFAANTDPEKTVVTVNAIPIREKQVIEEADRNINLQVAQMAAKGWIFDESTRNQMRNSVRDGIVDTLIERQLINEQLKVDKIVVTDAQIQTRFSEVIAEAGKTPGDAQKDAKEQGTTLDNIKDQIRQDLAIEKLYAANAKDKSETTEADAKKFYDENPKTFEQREEVRASHILIRAGEKADETVKKAARSRAEEILKKVKAGGDFAMLAREYSECGTKRVGGDLGYFGRGQTFKPFEDVVFAMKNIGDVSDIIETKLGYHIIKLTDQREARKKSFDEVKTQIIKDIQKQKIADFWNVFGKELHQNAVIEWSAQEKSRRDAQQRKDLENQLTEEEKTIQNSKKN